MKRMPHEELFLWGERMPITASEIVRVGEREFPLHHVQASDETRALLMLCMIRAKESYGHLAPYLLGKLREQGLEPRLRSGDGRTLLEFVGPVQQKLADMFGEQNIGVVVLINGEEPGEGKHTLDEMRVEQGDVIQVIYRSVRNPVEQIRARYALTFKTSSQTLACR